MAVREYVGARYVPKIYENSLDSSSAEWEASTAYEPLTIVTYNYSSYTSKQPVPNTVGNPADNPEYWACTGSYNGQIALLEAKIGTMGDLAPNVQTSLVEAINAITDFITPQMFGAVGDGVADDTQALQDCFDYSADNKIAVYIPEGRYNHTGIKIQAASHGNDEYLPVIYGSSCESSTLVHTGSGVAITIEPKDNLSYIDGIILTKIGIEGNANTTVGIDVERGAFMQFDSINIRNCGNVGFRNSNDFWMSSLTNIFVIGCEVGIELSGGAVTSIFMNNLYVYNSTDTAYKITGSYSTIGTLGADGCSGNAVYNFNTFNGDIGALACELPNVTDIYKFDNVRAEIGDIVIWKPTLSNTQTILRPTSSRLSIHNIQCNDTASVTSTLELALMYQSAIFCNTYGGNVIFKTPDGRASDINSIFSYQGVKLKTGSQRSFIGYDRTSGNVLDKAPFNDDILGTAIFSCKNNPRYTMKGDDRQWSTIVHEGDLFIESEPSVENVAGYVMLEDSDIGGGARAIQDVKRASIPFLMQGTTENRPSNLTWRHACLWYYDQTLGKPIVWSGASWRDAMGNAV